MEPEILYWEGPGWYASHMEGETVITKCYGQDPENQPDTYGVSGTPFWKYSLGEFQIDNLRIKHNGQFWDYHRERDVDDEGRFWELLKKYEIN